jgi:hypothetical protein
MGEIHRIVFGNVGDLGVSRGITLKQISML